MTPNITKITITGNNTRLIREFLEEIVVAPRSLLRKWAAITKQTPAVKLGYIGQHLASLITGVPGTGTGARGDDLADGSEVKSCNKIDQADKCKDCNERVMRFEDRCSNCGSENIERRKDSKWLFTIRDEHELNQYLNMDRVVLLLMDYPGFDDNDFNDIRISCFEIYPKEERMSVFGDLIRNHYENNYLPKANAGLKTNPMNLHPFGFQFYKCNPVKIFSCGIKDIDTDPEIIIDEDSYITPETPRDSMMPSLMMPSSLLKKNEWDILLDNADYDNEILPLMRERVPIEQLRRLKLDDKVGALPLLDERLRAYIPLREITSIRQQNHYQRH